MSKISQCKNCGVPLFVSKEQVWGSNGVINQSSDPDQRMLFCESEDIDSLFAGIEELIGVPIEHIVIESKSREVKHYVEKMVAPLVRRLARVAGSSIMEKKLSRTGKAYGYGDISLLSDLKGESGGRTVTLSVRNPHSILLLCGETLGAWEAIRGEEQQATYERINDIDYKVTAGPGTHPVAMTGMLKTRRYSQKPGDIRLERCGSCGIPLLVAAYRWNINEGTITHPTTNRRMAIFGPAGVEAIFDDLESELGEEIPETVIEAQKRCLKDSMKDFDFVDDTVTYREMLAMRGLGNLVDYAAARDRLEVIIENSCLTLVTVGILCALFELGFGCDVSKHQYEESQDGSLKVSISKA